MSPGALVPLKLLLAGGARCMREPGRTMVCIGKIPSRPFSNPGTSRSWPPSWWSLCLLAVLGSLAYLMAISEVVGAPLGSADRARGMVRARHLLVAADPGGWDVTVRDAWTPAALPEAAPDVRPPGNKLAALRDARLPLPDRFLPPSRSRDPPVR